MPELGTAPAFEKRDPVLEAEFQRASAYLSPGGQGYQRLLFQIQNSADAEEARQNILVRLTKKFDSGDKIANLQNYLAKAVANEVNDYVRRIKPRERLHLHHVENLSDPTHSENFFYEQLDLPKVRQAIEEILKSLPENMKEIMLLYYFEDNSLADIFRRNLIKPSRNSEDNNIYKSVTGLKTLLNRARAIFLTMYKEKRAKDKDFPDLEKFIGINNHGKRPRE